MILIRYILLLNSDMMIKSKTILEQKLFSKKHPLKSRKVSGVIDLKYSYTDKDEIYAAKDLWMDFYAGKRKI